MFKVNLFSGGLLNTPKNKSNPPYILRLIKPKGFFKYKTLLILLAVFIFKELIKGQNGTTQ